MEPVGRSTELSTIGRLLSGEPGFRALLLEGEAGIGKTTLWRAGVVQAARGGALVLAAQPTTLESRVPYAALGDLVRDAPEGAVAGLSGRVGDALRSAALLAADDLVPSDRVVARGLADLLRSIAATTRLVVAIDDVQWLDEQSRVALAYALRRLTAGNARVLLARRQPTQGSTELEDALPGPDLDRLQIGPLSLSALRDLLLERLGAPLTRPLLVRILRASGGNPYYALEIARELDRSSTASPSDVTLPLDVTRLTVNRILRLPPETRSALLRLALSSRERGNGRSAALAPAIDHGVAQIEPDGSIGFTHPLVAAAVVESAGAGERREAHLALAARAGDALDRARHDALAADGPDPMAATAAAAACATAIQRANMTAALELAELALRLTPESDPVLRLERAFLYADRLDLAGSTPEACAVLDRAIDAAPPGSARSRALARLGYNSWRGGDLETGLAACRRALEETDDLDVLAEIHESLTWLNAADLDQARTSATRLVAIREQQGDPVPLARARLLEAYYAVVTGQPPQRETIEAEIAELASRNVLDYNPVPEMWTKFTDRLDDSRAIIAARLERARELHEEQFVLACLANLAELDTWRGDLAHAWALVGEASALADEITGSTYLGTLSCAAANLAAIAGRLDDGDRFAAEARRSVTEPIVDALSRAAGGAVAFAAGRLREADEAFTAATAILDGIGMREPARYRFHGDHVEVLVGLGELERASSLVERLERRLAVFERPWLAVVACRGRALVAAAAGDVERAVEAATAARLAAVALPMPLEQARTDLLLGRLLRRQKRRGAAREALEAALAVFEALPAPIWAVSARDELSRLGLSRTGADLTEAEQAVAAAAARGLKNREIADQLFMSPKTVEAHLARAYRKLGIRTRAELGARLGGGNGREKGVG